MRRQYDAHRDAIQTKKKPDSGAFLVVHRVAWPIGTDCHDSFRDVEIEGH